MWGDGDEPLVEADGERLRVQQDCIPGGRVAGVPDGEPAAQTFEHRLGEDLGHLPHALVVKDLSAVAGDDPGAFLAAMLLRVEAEVGELCGFRVAVDREDPTFVVEFVERHLHRSLTRRRLPVLVASTNHLVSPGF